MAAAKLIQHSAANVASLPAPVGGWNARDSIANMAPADAVVLENFFPTVSSVVLRGGYTSHATGLGGQVQSLMSYSGGPTNKLFAAAATTLSFYDVSSSGAVGAAGTPAPATLGGCARLCIGFSPAVAPPPPSPPSS